MNNPTFAQLQNFFLLVGEGKITAENLQSFMESPNKFFYQSDYPVSVNYELSLADMIKAGKYDWKDNDITPKNCPMITYGGTGEVKLRLVHFGGRTLCTEEVNDEIEAMGLLRPATLVELLAFGALYPDKQLEFPIVATGFDWIDHDGFRRVPYIGVNFDGRYVDLAEDLDGRGWGAYCRFLAVSK